MTGRILIIDDEEGLRKLLSRIIALEGFHVEQASSLQEGLRILFHKQIDVVLCDVKLPDGNGVEFVKDAKEKYLSTEFILLTAYGQISDGVQAIKNGAFDYITKGNDNDRIIPLINKAMDKALTPHKPAVTISGTSAYNFDSIIGESVAIKSAITLAKKIAQTDATVLLLGETGTGKEVFASAIHANSKRSANAFIAINCSAFSKDLLEGELFGHKAGAFTGATKDKKGLIEIADGGTLLLDEIGDLNIELQSKLLRVLENGEFIKLGDPKISKANIRIIAATNRNLLMEVEKGNFREDLYYRLNIFTIELPPLRERIADMHALANYFLKYYAEKESPHHILSFTTEAMQLLEKYSWKGNIRELRNIIQRAVILAEDDKIFPAQLPFDLQKENLNLSNTLSLANVEKEHILKVLLYAKGNKTRTAELLGIGLTTLYRKMEEYTIIASK